MPSPRASASPRHTQVLIVGCGPAGAAAAITLARAGVQCTVLDRARFPRDKTCGDALSNDAVSILHQLGAGAMVLSGAHARVERSRALFPNGAAVERAYDPPGMIVRRIDLDDALRRAAGAAGAEVLEGHAVRSLIVEGGRVVGARGAAEEWRAERVIAADGQGSVARAALCHPKPAARYVAFARTSYFEGIRFHDGGPHTADHYFEHDLPCGYGWLFPAVAGSANVGVYQRGDHYGGAGANLDGAFERFVARHPERFAGAREVGPRRTWALPLAPAPWPIAMAGLLTVGDAANLVDPLSGEGIWQALRSGQLAAELILASEREAGDGLARAYQRACAREINHASRRRALVQELMRAFVALRLYRYGPIRRVLSWGYGRQHFEATKIL